MVSKNNQNFCNPNTENMENSPHPTPHIMKTISDILDKTYENESEKIEILSRYNGVYLEAMKEVQRKLFKKHILNQLQQKTINSPVLQELYDSTCLPNEELIKQKMVTISAKDGINPVKFWQRSIEHITNSKYIEEAIYCLEQRSEADQEPYGWHIHILMKTSQPKCKIIDKIHKCFKNYITARNYVDVTKPNENSEKYLKGQKIEAKMKKVEKDIKLREKWGIPNFLEKLKS